MSSEAKLRDNKENNQILSLIRRPTKIKPLDKKVKDYTTPPAKALVMNMFIDQVAPSPINSIGKQHLAARIKSINASTAPERKTTAFKIGGPKQEDDLEKAPVSVTVNAKAPDRKMEKPAQVNRLRKLLNQGIQ